MMGDGFYRARSIKANIRAVVGVMKPGIERCLQGAVDLVAPDACCLCGRPTGAVERGEKKRDGPRAYLEGEAVVKLLGVFSIVNHPFCRSCLSTLKPPDGPGLIGVCGVQRSRGWVVTSSGERFVHDPEDTTGEVHPDSPVRREAVPLEAVSPFGMNDASLEIVRKIKFSNLRSIIPLAAGAMASAMQGRSTVGAGRPVLVPVPMHRSALRRRGFNQSSLLAAEISRIFGIPFLDRALCKTIRTPRQSGTVRRERARNVRGVFAWTGERLVGSHVFLVDDLVTTGMTAASCASVVTAAGARRVTVVCFARAI